MLTTLRRELITRTVDQFLVGHSTGDRGQEMSWRDHPEIAEQEAVTIVAVCLPHFDLLAGLVTIGRSER